MMYSMYIVLSASLYGNTVDDEGLIVYLNAWTKSNDSLTNAYLLQYANTSRISVWYQYSNTSNDKCLSTNGMPWQDLQSWRISNCSVEDNPLQLDYRNPIGTEDHYICKAL